MNNSHRKTARIVGALFITATATSILGTFGFLESILSAPDYLVGAAAHKNQLISGVLIDAINSVVVVIIPVLLFPIFKKHSEALAIGYVASRIMESVVLIFGHVSLLALLSLSQQYGQASAPDTASFQALGGLLLAVNDWSYFLGPMIVFGMTALILNWVLYKSKLVPRFISIWGLIGALLIFAAGLLGLFGRSADSTVVILLFAPLALNEMVLAVWLIVKGFDSAAIASLTAKQA